MKRLVAACALVLALAACSPKTDAPTAAAGPTAEEAKAYLDKNAKEPGFVTTPSGLQYKVVRSGAADGPKPDKDDEVLVHYEGKFVNGEVFDSSYERGSPAGFRPSDLVPGWTEALQMMRPGDEWQVVLPPELGYGDSGQMPPNSVLIFRMELLAVRKTGG